jgi:endonuclease YncB( thermonuclease family)
MMNKQFMKTFLFGLSLSLATNIHFAQAETLVGRASVIDGDTIEIHGKRIRLEGIDAPESSQQCMDGYSNSWRCGQKASFWLDAIVRNKTVSCVSRYMDRYGRQLSTCFVDDVNVNNLMVLNGYAVAYRKYSQAYIASENKARTLNIGIWSSHFVMPWDWRRGARFDG